MREIPLSKGKVALVDDEDFERFGGFRWYASERRRSTTTWWYAVRRTSKRSPSLYLHRAIMSAPEGVEVDHINGDSLDCRRANLRFCDRQQNTCNRGRQSNNTSGYTGIRWQPHARAWRARVKVRGREKHVGYFPTIEEAITARNRAAAQLHGEFARFV